jgi:hypothetical protein
MELPLRRNLFFSGPSISLADLGFNEGKLVISIGLGVERGGLDFGSDSDSNSIPDVCIVHHKTVGFANGVPAVSDDNMSEWMDYLYMQNATLLNSPPAPKGVTVKLVAVGSNGDTIDIGTVTSDSGGMFKKMWTPSSEGEYTVYATFDGSDSYYGSYAQTALGITKAPTPPDGYSTNSGAGLHNDHNRCGSSCIIRIDHMRFLLF